MVFTRAQLDFLSGDELVEELIKCSNIVDQIKILTDRFDDFVDKYEKLPSELVISWNCNSLLVNRIINLERNALSNAQYIRREMLEINPVPHLTLRKKFAKPCLWLVLKLSRIILMPVIE